jgi:hypothetical protein
MNRNRQISLLALLWLLPLWADEITLVQIGDVWRFLPGLVEASSPVTAWRQVGFDDSAWPQGAAGFSLSWEEATMLPPAPDLRCVFFRKSFTVSDPQAIKWLVLRADYQAGFAAYLNGVEITRRGLTNDPVRFDDYALDHSRGAAEEFNVSKFVRALTPGANVLAIQVHVSSNYPNALVLAPELLANFQRGPFIQNTSASGTEVIWRTPVAADAMVEYGTNAALGLVVSDPIPATDHVLALTGLLPGTPYWYRVRSTAGGLTATSPIFSFRTLKTEGDITFAVFGDGESGGIPQYQVARAVAGSAVDLVLCAGDIMYWSFTLGRADTRCLSLYGPHMRTTPYFFTLGNHDLYAGDAAYLETFHLPTNSANGTEYFYSFDHGDAHFVSLYVPTLTPFAASVTNGLAIGSVQYCWLTNDLAASAKPWKLLLLHSPIHTSAPHRFDDYNHDGVLDRLQLAEILLPVARQYGVQAVFSGHDHDYERFLPVNGVHLFVTGGGGYHLYPLVERDEASAQFWARYHFLKVSLRGDSALIQAADPAGAIFDELTIQRAVPPPRLWPGAWHTPAIATVAANDGDGNVTGQTFDFAGAPIPALSGEWSNLGEVFANNDSTNLYLGFKSCMINADANIFLFVESPRLAGVTTMAGLGNGIADPDGQGADGLDFLENLSFTNFAPGLACILGDEFADGQYRSFQRPGLALNTGQGVFRLDAAFSDVPGVRVQQFNCSPQRFDWLHQGTLLEQNADFIQVAIPLAALGGPKLGSLIKLGAVAGGPGLDTNLAAQTRQLDTGFLGVALHGSGQAPVALEGLSVQLALSPTPGDSDGDGLPDAWELAHGLDPLSALGDDGPSGDADQDGSTNWQEFVAGTDPRDPASPLRLHLALIAPELLQLSWAAVIGKQYQLEVASESLTNFVAVAGFPRPARSTNEVFLEQLPTNCPPPRLRAYRLRVLP